MIGESRVDGQRFRHAGYAKVAGLLVLPMVEHLRGFSDEAVGDGSFVDWKKIQYNVGLDDPEICALLRHPGFIDLITGLMGKSMLFTDGIVFETDSSLPGSDWHIDNFSFKYINAQDDAATLWIPLDPIRRSEQDGGLSFVSKEICSGREFYKLQHRATQSLSRGRYDLDNPYPGAGGKALLGLSATDRQRLSRTTYLEWEYLSPFSTHVLDHECEAFDLDLGDAVFFTKDVFHRTNPLHPGPMPKRRAFALRFIAIDSEYDEINERILGSRTSSRIINEIKVGHGKRFDTSKAICLMHRPTGRG